jgi:hypothetical protein
VLKAKVRVQITVLGNVATSYNLEEPRRATRESMSRRMLIDRLIREERRPPETWPTSDLDGYIPFEEEPLEAEGEDEDDAEDDEAAVDPSFSPAPTPSPSSPVVVTNNCQEDVLIGNVFFARDQTYDARCAPYTTLKHGESVYLDVSPDSSETTYFSVYGLATQTIVPVSSATDQNLGNAGDYLARMVDPSKEHVECDNQLLGNDFYFAYTIESALISLC